MGMTREERLELLKQIEKDIHVGSLVSTLLEDAKSCAIHSVIEELEQESCGDCISRQADNLCSSCTNIGCAFQSGIVRTECAFYIPPHIEPDNCGNYVIQEPKTGHWIFIGNSDVNGLKICECDVCGKRTYGSHNYCPNCGARMSESKYYAKLSKLFVQGLQEGFSEREDNE